ncbi:glycoside hydrolase family 15 (plasmid) [Rhodococcus oxybenzonivorans]|uniref:Glycoside hydrolase family 15 n=1 Tax=Rhodococcus oxybenzonivorans TaxID=1990687 RepID=A0A2S2C574_9NOCA|nr:glycoside hydrolase family 15 protein [Rhodococcus oxybenzonivorans]AWK76030.1 glycoside hydrolase family 15 [Rhodococcus oxybenzonivorans]
MSSRDRIADYGLLGDTRTAALVDECGSIDWLCLPHFDGDPVFARLVAGIDGGHFAVGPAGPAEVISRRYQPGTAVLETEWQAGAGRLLLTDGMVSELPSTVFPTLCLVRRLESRGAPVRVTVSFDPRAGAARRPMRSRAGPLGVICSSRATAVALSTDPLIHITPGSAIDVDVRPGHPLTLILSAAHHGPLTLIQPEHAWATLAQDAAGWRNWSGAIDYEGPGKETVIRSLITLRLLTYSPSGAPVAAPTTSLPESLGGSRNWDYRYAWPRDASIGVGTFLGVGLVDEARAFLYWLLHASRLDRPRLPVLLTIHGQPAPRERELDWPGFADSRPVRVGNGARDQHQLDNYGWVLDAMWLLERAGHRLYGETWRAGAAFADEVVRRWREPDAGIWEVRGEPAHYVHSKLMAWLTLDRALRIADHHRTSVRRRRRWESERDAIAVHVMGHGFDISRGSYMRTYQRSDVDAALLLLPVIGIEPAGSPRLRGTIDTVRRELSAGGPLLYRYRGGDDGLVGDEGAFLPCSFWLVQALAATGAVEDATAMFTELIEMGKPLGLFGEEVDPASGHLLGNYPQALTHATLVQAALAIRGAQEGSSSIPKATP